MSTGLKANSDGSAALQVGGTDVITLTSGGAATFVTSPTTIQAGTAAAPSLTFSGDTNTGIYSPAADTVSISTGGTERLRTDSSGNLGLGVTPSAWWTSMRAVQVGVSSGGVFASSATNGHFLTNAYYNGTNWLRVNAGYATYYSQDSSGVHSWQLAGTSTAGSTITWTQAMTLDASGNLGIGTTSPSNKLDVSGRIATNDSLVVASSVYIWSQNRMSLGASYGIESQQSSPLFMLTQGVAQPIVFGTNSTERARIDSSGYTQFSSNLVMPYQGAPTTKNAAATLTGAELVTGILSYTGAAATVTLPTGTNIEGALTWSANNVSMDWFVINTGSGTCTIGANGNTTLGALTVTAATSARFRIRRTGTNTFTVYRL